MTTWVTGTSVLFLGITRKLFLGWGINDGSAFYFFLGYLEENNKQTRGSVHLVLVRRRGPWPPCLVRPVLLRSMILFGRKIIILHMILRLCLKKGLRKRPISRFFCFFYYVSSLLVTINTRWDLGFSLYIPSLLSNNLS